MFFQTSNMLIILGLLLVASSTLAQHHGEHHCYNCFHIQHPDNCTQMITCPHGKECFATHYTYTNPEGVETVYYHLGCESHGHCIHSDSFDHLQHGWLYPYQVHEVLCGHCCTEPGCNKLTCTV